MVIVFYQTIDILANKMGIVFGHGIPMWEAEMCMTRVSSCLTSVHLYRY